MLTLALLAAGCQQFTVTDTKPDVPEPEDTAPEPVPEPTVSPDIEVDPLVLDFNALPVNCEADPQTFTVRNVGDADLDVTDIRLISQGGQDQAFTLNASPRVLAPGEEARVRVTFTPLGYQAYDRVRVAIESNDPDEPSVRVDLFGEGAEDAIYEQSWTQVQPEDVDVLWVIDNSGSMEDDIGQLANAFDTFIQAFIGLQIDARIALTTTDMDRSDGGEFVGPWFTTSDPQAQQKFTQQATQGFLGSGNERGLDASKAALSAPLIQGPNAGFLRNNANLAVVVVSDEDDYSGVGVNAYTSWLNGLKASPDDTSFSGMVGPDGGGGPFAQPCALAGGGSASVAPRYHDVIRQSKGVWGDFCQFDIRPFLTFFSRRAVGLQFEFPLDFTPSAVGAIDVFVDGVSVSPNAFNGYTYDAATNTIVLNGTAVPDPGAFITVQYPYVTTCQ
jgi:hypothetical protein